MAISDRTLSGCGAYMGVCLCVCISMLSFRRMRKRGVLFTLAAILMVSVIAGGTQLANTSYLSEAQVRVVRLQTLDNFAEGVRSDLVQVLYTSAFRSLVSMQEHIADNGVFIDDVSLRMEELMLHGTLYGDTSSFMQNNTIPSWVERVAVQAQRIGLDIDLHIDAIAVYQISPWDVGIDVDYTLSIDDVRNIASFTTTNSQTSDVSIVGFFDPFSIIYTQNRVTVTINETPYEDDFVSNLGNHISGDYFAHWSGAPNYLMRLAGNHGASQTGIERLVNKVALSDNDFVIDAQASSADYKYWPEGEVGFEFTIGPAFFRLDNQSNGTMGHIERYGLQNFVIP